MFVAVAGNIGAGKSSLTALLAERFALEPVFEAAQENPYLADFYRDMPRYAFHSQMFFLSRRLQQHVSQVNPGRRVIQDRTLYEDAEIFARNLYETNVLDARDFGVYTNMVGAVRGVLRPPDLLIYLRAGLPTLRRHNAQRGRVYEHNMEDDYLLRLGALYERWFGLYALSPKLALEVDALDFVNDPAALATVLERLRPYLSEPILAAR